MSDQDNVQPAEDDVEGHRLYRADDPTDDVEGHRRPALIDGAGEDDVEGHKRPVPGLEADDDVEGHRVKPGN